MWLSWLEQYPLSGRLQVWFLVRARTWVVGSFPSPGTRGRQPINVSLSHLCFSLSLPLSLKAMKKKSLQVRIKLKIKTLTKYTADHFNPLTERITDNRQWTPQIWHLPITSTSITSYMWKQQQQCTQKSCLTIGATPSKTRTMYADEAKGNEKSYRK